MRCGGPGSHTARQCVIVKVWTFGSMNVTIDIEFCSFMGFAHTSNYQMIYLYDSKALIKEYMFLIPDSLIVLHKYNWALSSFHGEHHLQHPSVTTTHHYYTSHTLNRNVVLHTDGPVRVKATTTSWAVYTLHISCNYNNFVINALWNSDLSRGQHFP